MRRGTARVALVAALAVAAASCRAAVDDVDGQRVVVIGDSILAESQDAVRGALQADGWQVTVAGVGGSQIQAWPRLAAALAARSRPDVAVVELGTNDCTSGSCPDLGPWIDGVVHAFVAAGAEKVLWLTVQSDNDYPKEGAAVNLQLARAAARWPELEIVDFDAAFAGHPEWNAFDNIHLSDEGRRQLAQLIARAARPAAPATR